MSDKIIIEDPTPEQGFEGMYMGVPDLNMKMEPDPFPYDFRAAARYVRKHGLKEMSDDIKRMFAYNAKGRCSLTMDGNWYGVKPEGDYILRVNLKPYKMNSCGNFDVNMSGPGSNNKRIETDEFMLTLRNIKSSNGIIYADYEPENSSSTGKISIRISDKEVISSEASEYDKDFPIYLNHAIKALKKMANEEELPEEKNVMWY